LLKPVEGTELELLKGITAAIARLGLNKVSYPGDPITDLNDSANKCGVTTDLLLEAAYKFASAENPVIVYDAAIVNNLDVLMTLLKCAEISGAVLFNPKGGANSLAAAQYNLDKSFKLEGEKAVFLALGDETPKADMVNRLKTAKSLVVQAAFSSELTEAADVVLPAATMFEQDGHYLSADGRLQQSVKCLPTTHKDLKSNFEGMAELANALNIPTNGNWQEDLLKRPSPVEIHV